MTAGHVRGIIREKGEPVTENLKDAIILAARRIRAAGLALGMVPGDPVPDGTGFRGNDRRLLALGFLLADGCLAAFGREWRDGESGYPVGDFLGAAREMAKAGSLAPVGTGDWMRPSMTDGMLSSSVRLARMSLPFWEVAGEGGFFVDLVFDGWKGDRETIREEGLDLTDFHQGTCFTALVPAGFPEEALVASATTGPALPDGTRFHMLLAPWQEEDLRRGVRVGAHPQFTMDLGDKDRP